MELKKQKLLKYPEYLFLHPTKTKNVFPGQTILDSAIKINCYRVIQESSMRDSNLRKFTEQN